MSADIAAVKSETAAIVADTNELQTDWHDGGRLDLLLDDAGGAGTPPTVEEIRAELEEAGSHLALIKAKTDSLTFTVAGDVDCNVQTWKGSAAADMTGDAYARLGAPAGASVSADVAAVKSETAAIVTDDGSRFKNPLDMARMAAELKEYAKMLPGSNYVTEQDIEKRRSLEPQTLQSTLELDS